MNIHEKINQLLSEHETVLFMKGTKQQPRCGFSATVVQILNSLGVDYYTVDILADEEMRQGIKDYTNWPTIPQFYHQGQFIGGCDIVRELYQSGELARMVGAKVDPVKRISVKDLKKMMDDKVAFKLYDVRTQAERNIAHITGSILLTEKTQMALELLPKDTLIVFHCHHGGRSSAAASHYAQKGFRNVCNLEGGIEAWSTLIDASVPRY